MFTDLLERLGQAFADAGLPYMVIGGQAVLLYGEPRLTRDIDIALGIDTDQLPEVVALAESINLEILPEDPQKFTQETSVLPTREPQSGIRVDFVFSNSTYERQALNRTNRISIGDVEVHFASLEDLIIHKLFAGRPRDIEDVRGMLLKKEKIDTDYIKSWLGKFDVSMSTSLLSIFQSVFKEAADN